MAMSQSPTAETPVSAMNMTPLIDVLLVLLIMFVVTIPIATHSLEVDVGTGKGFARLTPSSTPLPCRKPTRSFGTARQCQKPSLPGFSKPAH